MQFQYGEDGIDVLNASFLKEFGFLHRNAERLQQQQLPGAAEAASKAADLNSIEKDAAKASRWVLRRDCLTSMSSESVQEFNAIKSFPH